MHTTIHIRTHVSIPPHSLGNDLEKIITEKAKKHVLNKEFDGVGLVTDVVKVISISGGKVDSTSGVSEFVVVMNVNIYKVELNDKINTTVKYTCLHGYYVNEPIEIFVGTKEKPTVKEGDKVTIEIKKIGFNHDGHFVVIAKQYIKEKKM